MEKTKIVGCDFLPDEKIIVTYQNSYIDEETRKNLEEQGWTIMEGIRLDRNGKPVEPNWLPLAV